MSPRIKEEKKQKNKNSPNKYQSIKPTSGNKFLKTPNDPKEEEDSPDQPKRTESSKVKKPNTRNEQIY